MTGLDARLAEAETEERQRGGEQSPTLDKPGVYGSLSRAFIPPAIRLAPCSSNEIYRTCLGLDPEDSTAEGRAELAVSAGLVPPSEARRCATEGSTERD